MRRLPRALPALLPAALLAGCAAPGGPAGAGREAAQASGPPPSAESSAEPAGGAPLAAASLGPEWRRGATAGRRWLVAWTPRPDPIPLNAPFEVDVVVLDPAGEEALPHLAVRVDATMPAHHHGMNRRPVVTARGDGAHTARGMLFHMPGAWELTVDVFAGTVSERARFSVELD